MSVISAQLDQTAKKINHKRNMSRPGADQTTDNGIVETEGDE